MNENEINSNVEQNVQNNMESLPMNDTIPETVPEVSETNNTLTEPEKPKKKGGLLKVLIIVKETNEPIITPTKTRDPNNPNSESLKFK